MTDIYCLFCVLLSAFLSKAQFMTECERGVKQPHPTQENAYQIFVRSDQGVRWMDQPCPAPQVFHPSKCTCVVPQTATPKPPPTAPPKPPPTAPPKPPPTPLPKPAPESLPPAKKSPWFSGSKLMKRRKGGSKGHSRKGPQRKEGPSYKVTSPEALFSPWEAQDNIVVPVMGIKECPHHRAKQGQPGQYEQWTEGGWLQMDCNWPVDSGLLWSQELCRCDWGPHRVVPKPDLNGVPAVCLMMLKMTFDDGKIKDVGRDLWVDLHHPFNMEAMQDETAVSGWAGAFRGAAISVPFFKMNTLGGTFRIKFRFQLCEGQPDSDLMLVNNGCLESDEIPSLQVYYRAWTGSLVFQMSTINNLGAYREECLFDSTDPWVDVNIHYDHSILEMFVNGQQCIKSAAFKGPIVQTDCPLTLLEDNYCGMLDEVVITRGCTPMQES